MNDFVAFDVETANPDFASICQIGIARFADGRFIDKWESLVNPEVYFEFRYHVERHRIDESKVVDAPTFPQVSAPLLQRLTDAVVIHYTHFDRTAIKQVFAKHKLDLPPIKWLDCACVVRRTWPDRSKGGYGLESIAARFGIKYQPHNAAEDARAAGEVFLRAMQESGLSVDDWVVRAGKPITPRSRSGTPSKKTNLAGNPDGPLYGEAAVVTGDFNGGQRELEELAADVGCDVRDWVTKATTILIVGDQDLRKLAGHEASRKQRDAQRLLEQGQDIRVMKEADFRAYVNDALRSG
jgi:DNA polymerase-3 subunit epsilon